MTLDMHVYAGVSIMCLILGCMILLAHFGKQMNRKRRLQSPTDSTGLQAKRD